MSSRTHADISHTKSRVATTVKKNSDYVYIISLQFKVDNHVPLKHV